MAFEEWVEVEEVLSEVVLKAAIRPNSKYFYQMAHLPTGEGVFDVQFSTCKNLPVKGGPGGQYNVSDLYLYVQVGDELVPLFSS